MIKKILICLDGSKYSKQIIPLAMEIALNFKSEVFLMRVSPEPIVKRPPVPGDPMEDESYVIEARKTYDQINTYLEKHAEPYRQKGIEIKTVIQSGRAGESIVSFANQYGIDLVALGAHGRGRVDRAVLGSVVSHVIKETKLPTLVIRT
jgi:nucleotide-binding universal stress UspA family protein